MTRLLILKLFLFIFFGLFLQSCYKFWKTRSESNTIRNLHLIGDIGKPTISIEQHLSTIFRPALEFIEKHIHVSKYSRLVLEQNLKRVGSKDTPEMHIALKYLYPILLLSLGLLGGFVLKSGLVFLGFTFPAVIGHFIPDSSLNEKIRKKNAQVLSETPRFVRTFKNSPSDKSIFHVVEDYLPIARDGLRYDLKMFFDNVRMGADERDELLTMADRVAVPDFYDVVQTIIAAMDADRKNAEVTLQILEEKIRRLNIDQIRIEYNKRPEYLDMINIALLGLLTGLFGVPIIVMYMNIFKTIMS